MLENVTILLLEWIFYRYSVRKLLYFVDNPRSLMHYSRHTIRRSLTSVDLYNEDLLRQSLPLPPQVMDYLLYADLWLAKHLHCIHKSCTTCTFCIQTCDWPNMYLLYADMWLAKHYIHKPRTIYMELLIFVLWSPKYWDCTLLSTAWTLLIKVTSSSACSFAKPNIAITFTTTSILVLWGAARQHHSVP